jgi:ketosteroid isomerase-like protein
MNNLELIKNLYQAFAQGDIPAVLQSFDEDIEWTEAEGFPYGGTYRGGAAILENVFMKLATEWDGYQATPDEFLDAGDRIVALGNYSASYKATGKSMNVPFAHVWTLQNGKIMKFVQYTDTLKVSEAL